MLPIIKVPSFLQVKRVSTFNKLWNWERSCYAIHNEGLQPWT